MVRFCAQHPVAVCVLSGILLWAGFPGLNLWWCAPWIGLVPLFLALPQLSAGGRLRAGWLCGLVCCGLTLLWLLGLIPVGGTAAGLGYGLLVPFLGALWGVAALLTGWFLARWRASAWLAVPAVWVCAEWVTNHAFTGFGWVLLGYTQGSNERLMQLAAIGGVYAVSGVIVLTNVLVWYVFAPGLRARVRVACALAAVAVPATADTWGLTRLAAAAPAGDSVMVGVVQGAFSTEVKWDYRYADLMWKQQVAQSRQAVDAGAEIVFWSEAALGLSTLDRYRERLQTLAATLGTPLVLGTNYFRDPAAGMRGAVTNSAVAVLPNWQVVGPYDKRHLTPFGEYTPLKRLFPFLDNMIPVISAFTPGTEITPLEVNGRRIQPLICFESVFPHEVRRLVNTSRPDFLAHLTNVGWFGRTIMPEQDLVVARYRAVELGIPMVRAANVGVSCVVDPYGRVRADVTSPYGRVFATGTLVAPLDLGRVPTLYARWGDWLVLCSALIVLVSAVLCYTRSPRPM